MSVPRKEKPVPRHRAKKPEPSRASPPVPIKIDENVERSVGISVEALSALYVLSSLKGFGPQKFKELYTSGVQPTEVLDNPRRLPTVGKRGDMLRDGLTKISNEDRDKCRRRAISQILAAQKHGAILLTFSHPSYPRNVFESNNPIPVLYVRGSLEVLGQRNAVACVGSRGIRPPYSELLAAFSRLACQQHFVIVSGFALGADTVGHETAFKNSGGTICVMPSGLDRPFPPENKSLWSELLSYPSAVFVTEFSFGMAASALTLRKRNKLTVAFARGVLVGQSSKEGGAMNAYRFAREQRKPLATFADDGTPETSGNKLISQERELGDALFPARVDAEAYRRWVQSLSSLT
jgi:DNA processing protein